MQDRAIWPGLVPPDRNLVGENTEPHTIGCKVHFFVKISWIAWQRGRVNRADKLYKITIFQQFVRIYINAFFKIDCLYFVGQSNVRDCKTVVISKLPVRHPAPYRILLGEVYRTEIGGILKREQYRTTQKCHNIKNAQGLPCITCDHDDEKCNSRRDQANQKRGGRQCSIIRDRYPYNKKEYAKNDWPFVHYLLHCPLSFLIYSRHISAWRQDKKPLRQQPRLPIGSDSYKMRCSHTTRPQSHIHTGCTPRS